MGYKSYVTEVKVAMKLCKHEFCVGVGTLLVAEIQPLVPVLTGALKRGIVSEVMAGDKGVYVGVQEGIEYGIMVEKGTSKQTAQPYLEPGAVNSIPRLINVARKNYDHRMGGK